MTHRDGELEHDVKNEKEKNEMKKKRVGCEINNSI